MKNNISIQRVIQLSGALMILGGLLMDSPKYPIAPLWIAGILLWMLPLLPRDIRNSGN